jgi:hypothetical protein
MAEYVYEGAGPVVGDDGGIVHPGDVRDFSEAPDGPPWRPLEEEPEPPPPVKPPVPPATTPAAAPAKPEGM